MNWDEYYITGAQQGWQCPICKRVHAPWVPHCDCDTYSITTTNTTNPMKIEPNDYHRSRKVCTLELKEGEE